MHTSKSFSNGRRWRWATKLRWTNAALRALPVDKQERNFIRDPVVGACFSRVQPTPLEAPELVICSRDALALAGLEVADEPSPSPPVDHLPSWETVDSLVPFLAGNQLFEHSETAAQCYCGHQFGYFSGQLGDGAALYLGEVTNAENPDDHWELQLKGAGLTPYSRRADGRKVLRSTLREFLASEHLSALGIPTTRAGSVVVSHKTTVLRDVFYDGNAKMEPCAVVLRIARTFLRFGSFEIFKPTDARSGRKGSSADLPEQEKTDMMRKMLDFSIRQNYPEIWRASNDPVERYRDFFAEIVRRTAKLVAKWQCVGFCHGVLNTDNMSIVGDTLDYGPYGFMEHFNPAYICNTSDDSGRYRYEAQPSICKWNCGVLADQLALVMDREPLEDSLNQFDYAFKQEYLRIMRQKLGLLQKDFGQDDERLIEELFEVLAFTGGDFTLSFRSLAQLDPFDESSSRQLVRGLMKWSQDLEQLKRNVSVVTDDQLDAIRDMLENKPMQARMYGLTQEVFEQLSQQREAMKQLQAKTEAQRSQEVKAAWSHWIDLYAARLRQETNGAVDPLQAAVRCQRMKAVNPVFVLRNHVAQKAIDLAEQGDYEQVNRIFHLLMHPFEESNRAEDSVYAEPADPKLPPLLVSCSS